MKINAKLGGRNMKLEGPPRNSYPGGIDARPFMVLGALPSTGRRVLANKVYEAACLAQGVSSSSCQHTVTFRTDR